MQNIVACAAGFTDGLGYGDNTKAAVIRLGLMETTKVSKERGNDTLTLYQLTFQFVEHYYPGSNLQTFFESCGVAGEKEIIDSIIFIIIVSFLRSDHDLLWRKEQEGVRSIRQAEEGMNRERGRGEGRGNFYLSLF